MRKVFAVLLCAVMVCTLGACCAFGAGSRNADIVFFIDSSGSMGNDIAGVRTNLAAFSNALVSNDINARFAVVEYRSNSGEEEITVHKPDGVNTWTSSASQVEAVLGKIYTGGGDGDTLNAIKEMLTWKDFRSDTSRFGFVLTDVIVMENTTGDEAVKVFDDGEAYRFYDKPEEGYAEIGTNEATQSLDSLMANTIQSLNSMNMHMSVISTSSLKRAYQNLYSQTGGEFFDIEESDYSQKMLSLASYIEEVVQEEESGGNNAKTTSLPYMPIEEVQLEELSHIVSGETILQRIARQANISTSQINVITEENKHLYGLSPAPEPSNEARQAAGNNEFIAKLNSLTLYSAFQKAGEKGYFLCRVNVPDEVLKMNLTTDNINFLLVTPGSSSKSPAQTSQFRAAGTEMLSAMLFEEAFGLKLNSLERAAYMLFTGPVADKAIIYMLRILLMLLGGCSSLAGIGMSGLFAAGGVILLRKFIRKR